MLVSAYKGFGKLKPLARCGPLRMPVFQSNQMCLAPDGTVTVVIGDDELIRLTHDDGAELREAEARS
jgi:hypothetical protein